MKANSKSAKEKRNKIKNKINNKIKCWSKSH